MPIQALAIREVKDDEEPEEATPEEATPETAAEEEPASGVALADTGEEPAAPVFIDGQKAMTLRGPGIAEEFQQIVDNYVDKNYEKRTP